MTRPTRQRGQGLLEAIIAIGVILTSTIASLTLIIVSIEANRGVRERLIAVNLAREAIEVVRMMRDSNWLANRDWTSGWAQPGVVVQEIPVFNTTSILPPANTNLTRWSLFSGVADLNADEAKVYLTPEGRYVQQGITPIGQDTGYRRLITVSGTTSTSYLVSVQVSYVVRGSTKLVTLQERFTNWKP
jgi:Tfp pilus assembly protein PilV